MQRLTPATARLTSDLSEEEQRARAEAKKAKKQRQKAKKQSAGGLASHRSQAQEPVAQESCTQLAQAGSLQPASPDTAEEQVDGSTEGPGHASEQGAQHADSAASDADMLQLFRCPITKVTALTCNM